MTATREFSADECVALLAEWAAGYPSARFVVIAISPDEDDAAVLGWGLALPEYVLAHLPEIELSTTCRSTEDLLRVVRHVTRARIAWIDPDPRTWPPTDPDDPP